MDLNVVKLTNFETEESSQEFLNKVNSKLLLDLSKSQIVENDEWIEMVEFSLPHLEKALTKEIKNIVTEEEIIKIELIKKVTVESVKHLSKNVNFVDRFNQKSGEVIPKKILNAYKEETFITYENRFLFSLIKLIEDYMYLREKDQETEYKGKNEKKANYHAEANYKKEKIKVNVEYISEKQIGVSKSSGTAERIQQIKKKIKDLKTTNVYQILAAKRVTLVKSPIKMTNVLLKNVHFQYALKLWNYLSDQMEIKDKAVKAGKMIEEKGITKKLVDEDIYLMNLIFSNKNIEEKLKGKRKNAIEDKKARKELTDNLIEKIIELNPDLSDKELKQMITDKLLVMKTRNVISLKPIEDRFKERIDKYMSQAKEVRLK
jgi:peptidase S26B, signal peptidase